MKTEKGQSLVTFVFGVAVIVVVLCALLGACKDPAQNQAMIAQAAEVIELSEPGSISNEVSEVVLDMSQGYAEELTDEESNAVREFTANGHAITGHAEAVAIQDCLNKNGGPMRLWRDRSTKDWYALCQLPDGKWGMMVCTADGLFNKTAYIPRDGTWAQVMEYLGKRGTPSKFKLPIKCD